jgi:hypothetical protein
MRVLIFIAGVAICALGFAFYKKPEDFPLLQGGLTLGGGLVICGLFSLRSKWHGIAGAGILGFLGIMRAVPAFWSGFKEGVPSARFEVIAGTFCLVVFIAAVRTLLKERTRLAVERLKAGDDPRSS